MNNHPKVSIILPVYNGEKYLRESVESILNQSFTDFELIIINDGSKDGSKEVLESYPDPRIRIVNQENKGLAGALNVGIALAQGEYIARQDQDDISLPERLREQVDFLDNHTDYGMVGTWAVVRKGKSNTDIEYLRPQADDAYLRYDLLFENHFIHSSVVIRKKVFDAIGLYSTDSSRQPPEDYELWSRVIRKYKVANIPTVLLAYRVVSTSMTQTGSVPIKNITTISAENLGFMLGIGVQGTGVWDFVSLYNSFWPKDVMPKVSLVKATAVFAKLFRKNFNTPGYLRVRIMLKNIRILFRVWAHYVSYLVETLL